MKDYYKITLYSENTVTRLQNIINSQFNRAVKQPDVTFNEMQLKNGN